jgi:DNA invertase Pin-like site-specific DNA recombinase
MCELLHTSLVVQEYFVGDGFPSQLFHPDYVREKIRASQLINRLQNHARGLLKPELISQVLARTGAGRDRAKAQGVRFGRLPSLTPHQRREAMERLAQGAAQAELARSYGVSQSTISKLPASGPFEASAVGA